MLPLFPNSQLLESESCDAFTIIIVMQVQIGNFETRNQTLAIKVNTFHYFLTSEKTNIIRSHKQEL